MEVPMKVDLNRTFYILGRAFVFFTLTTVLRGEYHQVPSPLANRAIYHPVVHQLNLFSCGYNALFNAANFEEWCGFPNPAHRYTIFKNLTLSYLNKKGHRPDRSSDNTITEELGRSILQLQPLYHLSFYKDDRTTIVPPGEVHISYPEGTSEYEKQRLFAQAFMKMGKEHIRQCRVHLEQHKAAAVIHFICYVRSREGKHIILISLYQNSSGRALYLFDNSNEQLSKEHDTVRYLSYLCQQFGISDKNLFTAPHLPRRWPHLDR